MRAAERTIMARKRMIDPAIWESIDFSKLSAAAKIVFIGLFSFADDEGRGRATASYLKSKLFAFSDEVSNAGVKKCLREISQHMSITFYADAKGDEYYTLDNWRKWQRLDRPAESQLPKYDARTCKLLYASKSKSCTAPEQPAVTEPKQKSPATPEQPASPQTNAPNPKTQPAPRPTGTKTVSPAPVTDDPAATAQTAKPALQANAKAFDEPSTSPRRALDERSTHDAAKTFCKREEEREIEREVEIEREAEKEREAQVSKIAPSALSPPLDLSYSLREKIDEWFKYKSERNEAYMPTGQKAFITTVCNNSKRYNEQDIIELISLSMSNGWKGVFWDRLDKRGTGKAKTFKQPQPRPRKADEFW